MRLRAALILSLMAAGALAQEPLPGRVIYYGDEQGFVGTVEGGRTEYFDPAYQETRSDRSWGDPHVSEDGQGRDPSRQPEASSYINNTELYDWKR